MCTTVAHQQAMLTVSKTAGRRVTGECIDVWKLIQVADGAVSHHNTCNDSLQQDLAVFERLASRCKNLLFILGIMDTVRVLQCDMVVELASELNNT